MISIDAEKAADKIQHPCIQPTLSKTEIEGNFFNMIKNIYEKLTTNITLNGEKLELPTKNMNKRNISPLITSFQHRTRSPN